MIDLALFVLVALVGGLAVARLVTGIVLDRAMLKAIRDSRRYPFEWDEDED